ncbi:MAG: zinc metalloprotease HtpX [Succiniclasticum sp.]|jgi:heat shock protein HtpX|nr:zinc metalloprotease HtpX [Succiniclasticum sp.]MEE3478550.1 zinc metalloprotease HtpX [Succiniclasticum sp.]
MKTAFLMTLLTVLLVLVGDYIGGGQGMVFMLILSVAMNFFSYWYSDKMVLAQYRARAVDENSAPALYGIVKRLAERAGLPMPKVYIIDDQVPNAFATGRNPEHAAVAVTTGLMNYLSPKEIEGVLGHEMTHVRNRDILIGSVAATMAGLITTITRFAFWFGGGRDNEDRNPVAAILLLVLAPIAAAIIQLAVSRSREYKADEGGGRLCGNPDYLADALEKISGVSTRRSMAHATEATAHMFIVCPFSKRDMSTLFSTHPATSERIQLLRKQAAEMRARGEIDSNT